MFFSKKKPNHADMDIREAGWKMSFLIQINYSILSIYGFSGPDFNDDRDALILLIKFD